MADDDILSILGEDGGSGSEVDSADMDKMLTDETAVKKSTSKDEGTKTRSKTETVKQRVIKGSTYSKSKTGDKQPVKRKAGTKAVSKPAKLAKTTTSSSTASSEVAELKSQVENLTNIVTNALKSKGNKSGHTASSDVSDNGDILRPGRPILSLDPNLDENEVVVDFSFDYFDDMPNNDRQECSGSFNPAVSFREAFNAPPSDIASTTPVVSGGTEFDEDWDIPQLQVDEKTAPKISTGLANAVNAVMTVRSSKDSIKSIQEKYLRPENCQFLKTPKVNIEIWREVCKFSHAQDLALQDIQRSLISGLIPVVQLANECIKEKNYI